MRYADMNTQRPFQETHEREMLVGACERAAGGARAIIQRCTPLCIREKSEHSDIVTDTDMESESFIMDILRGQYRGAVFLSEETKSAITQENFAKHSLVFVVDPIDGTTNYAYGIPFSAVSIGAWSYGEPVVGVIADANTDDVYTIFKNGELMINGVFAPQKRQTPSALKQAIVGTEWGYTKSLQEHLAIWNQLQGKVMAVRILGSAALALAYTALGRYTCYIHNMMKPYDAGAGLLMAQKAGLTVTNWDGEPYSIFDETILAAPPHLHGELIDVVNKI